ncbi:MAG: efflux RND transporter periplasmic adaptor subunit [Nitrospinae bacterium]|nr:efflux RND transporter periplasmic adaptor subunit [Nitrospinota bacterium]
MKKIVIILLLFLPLFAYAAEKKEEKQMRPSLVRVSPIQKGTVNPLQDFVGTVYFNQLSNVASATNGLVEEVLFEEGESVKKDDVLVRIEHEKLDANISADQSALRGTISDLTRERKNLSRYEKLLKQKSISRTQYDQTYYLVQKLRQSVKTLESQIKAKKIERDEKEIKAPFNGIIVKKTTERGEWVSTGKNVATIVNTKRIDAVFNVPQRFLKQLQVGDEIKVYIENKEFLGKVDAIIPQGDMSTRTFPLKIRISTDEELYEGMQCTIKLKAVRVEEALLVPRDAVIRRFGQEVIFIDNHGKAMMVPVKVIGFENLNAAVAAQGIQAGMMVVVKGNERIFPDMPLMVVKGEQ